MLATVALLAACDQGKQHDQQTVGPPVHIVHANVGPDTALPADGSIQFALDRLLLPETATRQSFILADANNNALEPIVTYDPVKMLVTLSNPDGTNGQWLTPGQPYKVIAPVPFVQNGASFGLKAIDGAGLESQQTIGFLVTSPLGAGGALKESFCADVLPIFQSRCGTGACHGAPGNVTPSERFPDGHSTPAAGLVLDNSTGVAQTAIGRVAQGSNTGARAGYPGSYGDKFGIDMPIIDANNNPDKPLGSPGNSWLMYKLLLATPLTSETTPLSATDCKGGTVPFTKEPLPAVETTAPGDDERARLSDYVLGNQMPYPPNPGTDNTQSNLTVDELERVQTWIAQGAVVDDCSVCIPPTK
ncbi:MAG TPA: hypothetical protein VF407_21815 [Polyangiaceae bacterium]